jgi:ATP diphosphatase
MALTTAGRKQTAKRTEPRPGRVAPPIADSIAEAIAIIAKLRGPQGCPWDREQTFDSIMPHTLEETYEVFDAIERRAWPALKDELGDLLLQVLFYAQMAAEAGYFDISDVAATLNAKLIRRHPHIFPVDGQLADATTSDAVLRNWDAIKLAEKEQSADKDESGLDSIPRTMPAMLEARKIGSRAAKVGFDWPDVEGIVAKLDEEVAELKAELAATDGAQQTRVQEEFGDLLFTAINLARHLKLDPEAALRGANAKFRKRFTAMERDAGGFESLRQRTPEQLEELWSRAKKSAPEPRNTSAGQENV